jgi:hypothetical protein
VVVEPVISFFSIGKPAAGARVLARGELVMPAA